MIRNSKSRLDDIFTSCHILVEGFSGTGKTFLVECLAGQLKIPLLKINLETTFLSDSKQISLFLKLLREFLSQNKRAIIFFKNLDSFAKAEDSQDSTESHNNRKICNKLSDFLREYHTTSAADSLHLFLASAKKQSELNSNFLRYFLTLSTRVCFLNFFL